ncbi:MAG: hypothetical protein ACR2GW_11430 [Pyrinomonadaceae bacterium]|jgi:hypothetical protein
MLVLGIDPGSKTMGKNCQCTFNRQKGAAEGAAGRSITFMI